MKRDIVEVAEEFGREIGKPFNQTGADWTLADIRAFSLRLGTVRAAERERKERPHDDTNRTDNSMAQEAEASIHVSR